MARLSGSWNKHGFDLNSWSTIIEDKEYLDVAANRIRTSGSFTMSGGLVATDDIDAAGGYAQSFVFHQNNLMQGQFTAMTSSIMHTTASIGTGVKWTSIPMVRAGSVLGLALYSGDVVKSGSLSASVTVDGVASSAIASANTGSTITMTPLAKDTVTFTAGQVIGVALTASSTYLHETDITSGSFIATVLVEM